MPACKEAGSGSHKAWNSASERDRHRPRLGGEMPSAGEGLRSNREPARRDEHRRTAGAHSEKRNSFGRPREARIDVTDLLRDGLYLSRLLRLQRLNVRLECLDRHVTIGIWCKIQRRCQLLGLLQLFQMLSSATVLGRAQ